MEDKKKVRIKNTEQKKIVQDKKTTSEIPSQPVGFNPMAESAKEVIKGVAEFARKRLAKNMMPSQYEDTRPGGKSTFRRGLDAIVLNKKEPERVEMEQYFEKGYGLKGGDEDKLRFDLLSQYGGLKQKYNTVQKSKYKPVKSLKQDVEYVDSKIIGAGLIDALSKEIGAAPSARSKKDLDNLISSLKLKGSSFFARDEKTGEVQVGKTGGVKGTVTGLGTANIAISEDEKGPYISYYDVWDIDPNTGTSKSSVGSTMTEKAKSAVSVFGKNILAVGSKPPEIYGRIYFDKKTGKPIL
jgi:hypothetical protein